MIRCILARGEGSYRFVPSAEGCCAEGIPSYDHGSTGSPWPIRVISVRQLRILNAEYQGLHDLSH
jgi:hypothetical protein